MLTPVAHIDNYSVCRLTKEVATTYQKEITEVWNLIPLSKHAEDDILLESSGSDLFHQKWKHSLIVLTPDQDEVAAFIVGYEREAEANNQYPKDNLHMKSLSVNAKYQHPYYLEYLAKYAD